MKFLFCAMLLFSSLSSPYIVGQEYSVIASYCNLYQTPSFEEVLTDSNGDEYVFPHGYIFEYLEIDGDFVKVQTKINDETVTGYAYKYYLTNNKNNRVVYPEFNGKVIADNAHIYDIDGVDTYKVATLGQEIYIYGGFNDKEEFTAVAIVLEDNSLYYGLMKTEDISPYGVSGALIASISIIAALVTIIMSVLLIRKTRKNKNK